MRNNNQVEEQAVCIEETPTTTGSFRQIDMETKNAPLDVAAVSSNNNQVEDNNPGQAALHMERHAHAAATENPDVEIKNALMVVASLIMAATFQAVVQPPGGLWQEDSPDKGLVAGKSILASKQPISFGMFILFNTLGFHGSYLAIWLILEDFPMKMHMKLAFYPLTFTYSFCLGALTPGIIAWFYISIPVLMPFLFPMILRLLNRLRTRE